VSESELRLAEEDLRQLEAEVERALGAADESGLRVLGYGEISLVLGCPAANPAFACKRLPVFPSRARFEDYRETLEDYLAQLRERGIDVVETELRPVERADGTIAGYAVQPVLAPETLATSILRDSDPAAEHPLVEAVVEAAFAAIGPHLGIDAQLSNWTWEEGRLRYLDVTTPMIWDADGRPRLDFDLLVRPLPAPMRWPTKRFLAPKILDGYRKRRGVMSDLCGNLIKERLESWIPAFLDAGNRGLEERMTEQQVRSYYRSDRRLWGLLLALRHLDRSWQRRVRRRPYPFLLPRRIQR
jgi:hypothetical protein